MDSKTALENATRRREELNLGYAGAVTPEEAHRLAQEGGAVIVDVRTDPEIGYVGSIPGSLHINWQIYPDMAINDRFLQELEQQAGKDKTVLFICRSGVRSHHAAAMAADAGWGKAYNVLEGFEGELDLSEQRGKINGWRFRGLPWKQV